VNRRSKRKRPTKDANTSNHVTLSIVKVRSNIDAATIISSFGHLLPILAQLFFPFRFFLKLSDFLMDKLDTFRFMSLPVLKFDFAPQRRYVILQRTVESPARTADCDSSEQSTEKSAEDSIAGLATLYISETVLHCNRARWKAFTYHARRNCFTSSVAVSATLVIEKGMRPCKYCVPDVSTGESVVATVRKTAAQIAADAQPKLPKVKFGHKKPGRKRRKTGPTSQSESRAPKPQIKLTISTNAPVPEQLPTPDSEIHSGETLSPESWTRNNEEACSQIADNSRVEVAQFTNSDELSTTDPSTSSEEVPSPWFDPFSPGLQYDMPEPAQPGHTFLMSPFFWGSDGTY
jgi:hypothetical protein